MDEILYLEPDEEITSVIDKIKQSKAVRLSLVIPREATLLQSVVNLRLLLKEASIIGKEIAIVTADKIGRNLAAKVGLKVYESVKSEHPEVLPPAPLPTRNEVIEIDDTPKTPLKDEKPKGVQVHHFQEQAGGWQKKDVGLPTPQETWRPPKIKKEIDWSRYRKILWPLLAIVVLLILTGAFLIFPKVNIQLQVQAESFQKNLEVTLQGDKPSNPESKIYGGGLIDLTREKEEKFPTTGKKNLGGKAIGTLTLYNYWDSSEQNFGQGTKFSSSSKTFVGKTTASVPGTSIRGGNIVPGTATVEIEAENPGEEYNVKAGRFTIVGLSAEQQEKIYGQSSKDLTGGFSKEVQVVSQADYDSAKEKLTKTLTEDLKKDLADKIGGQIALESGLQIDIVEEISSVKVDGEAQDFNLKIKQRLRQIAFSKNDFEKFIVAILTEQIPTDKMISLGPNDLITSQVKEKRYDQNLVLLDVSTTAKISSEIDKEKIKENLLGKNRKEAEKYLERIEGLAGSSIQFRPAFWPLKRIPNFRRNVDVKLDYLEPEAVKSPTPVSSHSPLSSPGAGT